MKCKPKLLNSDEYSKLTTKGNRTKVIKPKPSRPCRPNQCIEANEGYCMMATTLNVYPTIKYDKETK